MLCTKKEVFWLVGLVHLFLPCYSQINTNVDSLERILSVEKNDSIRAEILHELSISLVDTDFKKFSEYAMRAIDFAEKSSDSKLQNKIISKTGNIFLHKGLLDQAVQFHQMQLELGQKVEDKNIIGRAYFNLANIKLTVLEFEVAEQYLRKGVDLINEYNLENNIELSLLENVIINNSFGLVYSKLNQFDLAKEFYLEGIELSKGREEFYYNFCQISNNYADLLMEQKQYDEAKIILNETLKINNELNNKAGIFISLYYLGNIAFDQGDFQVAKSYYLQGFNIAQSHYGFSDKHFTSAALADVYKEVDQLDSAIYYLDLSKVYEDSLSVQKAREELLKIDLTGQFRLTQEQLKGENNMLFIYNVLLLFIGLGVLAYLLFYLKRNYFVIQRQHLELKTNFDKVLNKNKILVTEIDRKDQELMLSELKALKDKELIKEVSSNLDNFKPLIQKDEAFQMLVKELKSNSKKPSWEEFEIRFKQIHGQFYDNLLKAYPDLTLNERRLAAFLKLQMNSKEISNATGQSIRAVELGRSRLRKKLNLINSKVSLYDFFLNFGN